MNNAQKPLNYLQEVVYLSLFWKKKKKKHIIAEGFKHKIVAACQMKTNMLVVHHLVYLHQ